MPIPPPPPAENSITTNALKMIGAAMKEIGALAAGETLPIEQAADVLEKLQRLIDSFNARRPMVYSQTFTSFVLPVNTQPVLIGPGSSANFQVTQRPVDIDSIGLILNNTTPTQIEIWLNKRDKDWWAEQRVKNLTSTLPTDFYYEPDWEFGSIFFWPIPTTTNNVLIQSRTVLKQITNYGQSILLPPGYWNAIVYCLAESIGPMFERPISSDLLRLKQEAMKVLQTNNIHSPRGTTGDAGMPGMGRRGDFNYYSGMPNP